MAHWKVQLQSSTGEVVDYDFKANWEPTREGVESRVGVAAAIEKWNKEGRKTEKCNYAPISVKQA